MKFLELYAKQFGTLVDRNFEFHSPILVVFGHNEAGKSTFHNALETLLYGFDPGSREKHPLARYRPGPDLELGAKVEWQNGVVQLVERRLLSKGKLTIKNSDGEIVNESGNNAPLPPIQGISKSLFQSVYSLTANDTSMKRDDVREHIQELLLGKTGLRGAQPIVEVRRGLLQDAQALWRTDQKGKPKVVEINKELRDANRLVREAKKQDADLVEARQREAQLARDLSSVKESLTSKQQILDRSEFIRDYRQYQAKVEQIREVEARLAASQKDWSAYAPIDPLELQHLWDDAQATLRPAQSRLAQERHGMDPKVMAWLDHAAEIQTVAAQEAQLFDLKRSAVEAQGQLEASKQRLKAEAERLGVSAEGRKRMGQIPVARLFADADSWEETIADYHEQTTRRHVSNLWILFALVGCAGIALLGVPYGPAWVGIVLAAIGFGAAFAMFLNPIGRQTGIPVPQIPERALRILESHGIPGEDLQSPSALNNLAHQLQRIQETWESARETTGQLNARNQEVAALETGWHQIASKLGLDFNTDWDASTLPARLRQGIESAKERKSQIALDQAERKAAQEVVDRLEPKSREWSNRLQWTQSLLKTAFPERHDITQAWEAWQDLERQRQSAKEDWRRLSSSIHFASIDGPNPDQPEGIEVGDLRGEIKELAQTRDEITLELGELKQKLKAGQVAHQARATEAVLALEEQKREVLEERDGLALLGRVMELAEREYRAENEPQVLERASAYLSEITGGRYTRLSYPPQDSDALEHPTLQVLSQTDGLVDVEPPLSRGIQEQVYLALRLGTLDYLDQGRERLPLILDEALVHWDRPRRLSLYRVLKTLSKERQVILFTCHELLAEEAEEAMDARLIALQAGDSDSSAS